MKQFVTKVTVTKIELSKAELPKQFWLFPTDFVKASHDWGKRRKAVAFQLSQRQRKSVHRQSTGLRHPKNERLQSSVPGGSKEIYLNEPRREIE